MNVGEIITAIQDQAEEIYDTPTWIDFINQALDDLTPVVKLLRSKGNIPVSFAGATGTILLTSDSDLAKAHEIINVYFTPPSGTETQLRRLPLKDNYSKGWKMMADSILLQNCGSTGFSKADFYKKMDHVTTTSDTPELPSQYHNLLILYACAKSQQKEEELDDRNSFYSEYVAAKNRMGLDRIWDVEPHMRKYIKKARLAAMIGGQTG